MNAMQQQDHYNYSHQSTHISQDYNEHLHHLLLQNHQQPWALHPFHHSFNPTRTQQPEPFPVPYGSNTLFNPKSFNHHDQNHIRIISDALGPVAEPMGVGRFGLQTELAKIRAQEMMDAKALAASRSHSEAERRRRERINNHLAKLRSLLPSTTKTDKASLLAEVVQHMRELKDQTSPVAETNQIPAEADELTVSTSDGEEADQFVIKASLSCHDRSDLLPDVMEALKSLRLRTLKAEIATVGSRVRNVLFLAREEDSGSLGDDESSTVSSIEEALRAVMQKASPRDECPSLGSVKRQRIINDNARQYFS